MKVLRGPFHEAERVTKVNLHDDLTCSFMKLIYPLALGIDQNAKAMVKTEARQHSSTLWYLWSKHTRIPWNCCSPLWEWQCHSIPTQEQWFRRHYATCWYHERVELCPLIRNCTWRTQRCKWRTDVILGPPLISHNIVQCVRRRWLSRADIRLRPTDSIMRSDSQFRKHIWCLQVVCTRSHILRWRRRRGICRQTSQRHLLVRYDSTRGNIYDIVRFNSPV